MTEQPVFVDLLPPCNHTCPAGENIQLWIKLAGEGKYHAAWRSLVDDNPLPAIVGRACYHPCESNCNRKQFDEAVNVHALERFLGDEAIRQGWQFERASPFTGKRVLVVGAGPSGLSAAYHLRRFGHQVTISDAGSSAGGMMRYGIPKYRLPRNILDAEVARIEALGIAIKLNTRVDDLANVMKEGGFDAVFLAVGAHLARRAFIPARDARKIFYAANLLRDLEDGATPLLGRRVLVFGGGNTALDTARTAKRLGAEDALIVYRRTRQKMPVKDYEIQEAMEEGVSFKWLTTVKASNAESFVIERMQLDENGFPQPTGEFETLAADSLILALGQDVDLGFLKRVEGLAIEDGVVRVDEHMMTGCPGVFAGGDMVPAERAVSVAVGHGKKAARNIDAYLRGEVYGRGVEREIATFDRLNLRTHNRTARTTQQPIDLSRRQATFDEVFAGLDEGSALFEAKRCLSCGNCNECDNCYQICPGEAIQKLGAGKRFKFEYGNCDGCGLCAEECPCGAIQMQGIEKGGLGLNWA